ncbi:hypothetical protein GCM10010522_22850 [Kribbella solani]
MTANGRVDRREPTAEPADHLALRRERLLALLLTVRRLSLLWERLLVLTLLAWVLALLGVRLVLLLLTGVRLLLVVLGLLLLAVLWELLLRRRTVAARLPGVRVLRRLGRGCGHEWFL